MTEQTINIVFPTCFSLGLINREFTKNELDFVDLHKNKTYKNTGNSTSLNTYILDEPEMQDLKKICLDYLKDYVEKVYKNNSIEIYITQSWLNYSNKNDHHHLHSHSHSFLSGVVYFNTNNNDIIALHSPNKSYFKISGSNWDVLNSENWLIPVKNKNIIIFPSNIEHSVPTVTGNKTRISLAFNTFIKGNLGNSKALTELKL